MLDQNDSHVAHELTMYMLCFQFSNWNELKVLGSIKKSSFLMIKMVKTFQSDLILPPIIIAISAKIFDIF